MPFDLNAWKMKLTEHLPDWRSRMQDVKVRSVSVFLSAVTLWPIVEAVQKGEWSAISLLISSVGSNLLATRLDNCKSEADVAQKLEESVEIDPALREELDTLLEKLDVFSQATQVLRDADRQWFTDTLRAELAQLGNLSRFTVHLDGAGAIATESGVAAGAGAIAIGGSVQNSTINVGSGQPTSDAAEALASYLRVVANEARYLSLQGLDIGASDATGEQQRLDLIQVYVELSTMERGTALDAVRYVM